MLFYLYFAITLIGIAVFFSHYYLEKRETGYWKIPRQSLFILSLLV